MTHDELASSLAASDVDAPEETEIWLPIAGYEGLYEISSFGRVKSLARAVVRRNRGGLVEHWYGERMRSLKPRKSGYVYVNLYKNDVMSTLAVHLLVIRAFRGEAPPGLQCRHLDSVSSNNGLANLTWGTPVENAGDRVEAGTYARGDQHGLATFSEATLKAIADDATHMRPKAVMAKWNISKTHLARVRNGKARSRRQHGNKHDHA